MGLDTSHDCWSGSYNAFGVWRHAIARAAGIPLALMAGFYDGPTMCTSKCKDGVRCWHNALPLPWEMWGNEALVALLCHSDCDGVLAADDCGPLAQALEELLPTLEEEEEEWVVAAARRFIAGLRRAVAAGEAVEFR